MVFVERDTQLTRLRKLLQGCLHGSGGVAAVSGPVASGKTELLQMLGQEAAAAGAATVDVSGLCAESGVPLGVVGQLFRHPALAPPARDRARLLLEQHALVQPCESDLLPHGQVPSLLNQELFDLLRAASERRPLVLAVDDLHFADAASLHSLIWFGSRLRGTRILLVLAEPDVPADGAASERSWRTALLRQPHFTRVRLGPLSPRGTAEALAQLVGPAVAAGPEVGAWHRLSGGNPLLLRALAEDHRAVNGPLPVTDRSPGPVPGEEFGRAVETCVRRGGSRFRDVARALAVLDDSGARELTPRLLGRRPSWVEETVQAMNACGVLDSGRFRHRAGRAAVLAGTPLAERSALQLRAARLLHDRGEPAAAVAALLVAAGHSPAWGLPVLLEATRAALRRDEVRLARACLELAEEAVPEQRRVEVALLRAMVEFRSDPVAAFRHLQPLVADLTAGRLSGGQSVALLRRLLWHGGNDEIATVLRRLEGLSAGLDPVSAVEYHSVREWLHSSRPALLGRVREQRPPELPDPAGVPVEPLLRVASLLSQVLHEGADAEGVHTAELVLQTTPLDDGSYGALQSALQVLVLADRCALAATWCDALLRESAGRGVPVWRAMFAGTRADIAVRQGDARAGQRHARDALTVLTPAAWGVSVGAPLSSLLLATAAAGGGPGSGAHSADIPDLMFQTRFGPQYLHARGRLRLAEERLHGALDDLLRCGQLLREWDMDLPAFVPWRGDAVEVLLRLGRTAEARSLAVEQLDRPSAEQPRTRGAALRALASASEARQRQALLRQAVDLLEEGGDRWELVRALADLSAAHRRSGQDSRAGVISRQAMALAEEQGFAPLLRKLRAEERHGGSRTVAGLADGPACAVLSGSERQVAALAASGRSNREIADRLHVTVSTVEQHLTHVYRKLKVKGRAHLPESLIPQDREELLGLCR